MHFPYKIEHFIVEKIIKMYEQGFLFYGSRMPAL